MDHSNVFLFPSEQEMRVHDQVPAVETKASASSPPLAWDGRIWFVEEIGTLVHLRPEVGERLLLAFATFEQLIQTGAMQQLSETAPSPMTPEVRAALTAASPKAQHRANERLQQILLYVQGGEVTVPKRSIQRWLHAYTSAETRYECGYVGLLDHVAQRGNRNRRAPDGSMQLLQTFLKEHYATPKAKRAAAIYHLYVSECERVHLSPVSERTFYRERAHFATPDVTVARLGRRAAYGEQPFFYSLDQTTPRHGQRPFELAHLDHTELDLLLVSSVTGKPLEKPWLTLLTDAYSRRILACCLSYDPPSYRSTMMILRICVQRHLRLPQEIMVDRGADFGSVYFETLLSRYEVTKKERPPAQPRFGSILERLFGTTNTMLLNQLRGNTQATKVPRQMDRSVNPKHQAVWTLQRFSERFDEWAYEVYDQMEHPALFQSPRDTFTQGMARAGMRLHRLIAYSEEFLMLTRPTTHTGQVKIHAARGITVNGLRYWNAVFQNREVAGTSVPVRYEPYDMAVVYVFVQGQWLECIADNYAQVHGRSEREWRLILDEWRAHQRQHGKARTQVHIPLVCDVDSLLKERWWFAEWSVGCVGILRDWLVETVAALLAEGQTTLTREALQAHALQGGQRVRLEMEARAGEQRVEKGKAATQQQLQELNGTTVPLPRNPASPSSRIGERVPQRDPVGESENLTNPLPPGKCPVSNQMVNLDFHLFTQSAVAHVECPTCGSVRKGTLKKNHITFPPHEKLRSRSTHSGSRWLKYEEEVNHAEDKTRRRKRSKFARPYILRLINLRRLTCPSSNPLL